MHMLPRVFSALSVISNATVSVIFVGCTRFTLVLTSYNQSYIGI